MCGSIEAYPHNVSPVSLHRSRWSTIYSDPRDLGIRRRPEPFLDHLDHIQREARDRYDDRDLVYEGQGEYECQIYPKSISARTSEEEGRTEVSRQDSHRPEIDDGSTYLREDHVRVPGGDLEGDHDKLVDDEGGEGDGDDVKELRLEEKEGKEHDDPA